MKSPRPAAVVIGGANLTRSRAMAYIIGFEVILNLILVGMIINKEGQIETISSAQVALEVSAKKAEHSKVAPQKTATSKKEVPPKAQAKAADNWSVFLKTHPEAKKIYDRDTRRFILSQVDGALAKMNLPKEKLDKVRNLFVEEYTSREDGQTILAKRGMKPGTPEYVDAFKVIIGDLDDEIRAAIGAEGLQQVNEYSGAAKYKTELEKNYASDFIDAGMPLADEQIAQLSGVMRRELGNLSNWARDTTPINPSTGLQPAEEMALKNAGEFLSPAQLELLRTRWVEEHQRRALQAQFPFYLLNHR